MVTRKSARPDAAELVILGSPVRVTSVFCRRLREETKGPLLLAQPARASRVLVASCAGRITIVRSSLPASFRVPGRVVAHRI